MNPAPTEEQLAGLSRLRELERRNIPTNSRNVGMAFAEIRDKKLYRSTDDSFSNYCLRRFGMEPRQVNVYLGAAGLPLEPEPPKPITVKPPGMVYVVAAAGLYKIGMSRRFSDARITSLQTASPILLSTVCKIKTDSPDTLERDLHRKFSHKRVRGEWFSLTPEDVESIKSVTT
jgi:hypothetical protein